MSEYTDGNTSTYMTPDHKLTLILTGDYRPLVIAIGKPHDRGGSGYTTILTGEDIDYDDARRLLKENLESGSRYVIDRYTMGEALYGFDEPIG